MLLGVGLLEALALAICLIQLLATGHLTGELVWKAHVGPGIVLLFPFAVAGYALAARTVPVKVRRYSALDGTVEVRFRNADYAEKFVAGIRAWEKKI
jgi:hypothetical protein